ncbi:antibiotic biosynthesis monooxygenase [Candidatus Babeliales bacterium]|nr:antibiotic biosynthesis monooxygenase [Candidatus Babeliales bacterium]MBP9843316.1 antibiotic biosynthesis monooxygenase [Candidatus Babeliales bacterium]
MINKLIVKIWVLFIFFCMNINLMSMEDKLLKKEINPFYVVVILEAKVGQEQNLKEELLKVQKLSLEESVCLDFRVHEDVNNPVQFVLYEAWTSKEGHALHFKQPYITELGNKLDSLLEKPYIYVFGKDASR